MSNLLFMDETNGNGVYATKHPHNATAATNSSSGNSNSAFTATANYINNSMTGGATVAAPAAATLPTSVSNEDLSQSLSEYTDADESISAPTEFLAEFLSAVMLKDYKKALKYCKLILQYEPHNSTAKEFYPLILDKLRGEASSDSDENYNKSSSPEMILEQQSSDPSVGESDDMGFNKQQMVECVEDAVKDVDVYGVSEDNSSGEPNSRESHMSSSSCESTDHSLSESVDEENDNDDDDGDCDVGDEQQEEEDGDVLSVSGEDLPIDDSNLMGDVSMADDGGGGSTDGNGSQSSRNSSSGGEGRSRSDNTTHSYSSLLLEEEEADIVPVCLQLSKELSHPDLDVSNGNKIPSTSCSDSESPTEPLTQRLAAILLSKCGVSSNASNH